MKMKPINKTVEAVKRATLCSTWNLSTRPHTHNNFRESNKIIKAQYDCVYLRREDRLYSVVCLFCVCLVPDTS